MKIGLSVSFCIRDMIEGRVNPEEVSKIIGSTCARPEDIDSLIATYRRLYWSSNPDAAEALFRKMYTEGRIEQPRLTGDRLHYMGKNDSRWVNNEDEIRWEPL
jgi:hypothetical protein